MAEYLIIPEIDRINESIMLAEEQNLGFEFNDFFAPVVLDDTGKCERIINFYGDCKLPNKITMHGAFYDVTVFSDDIRIRSVSCDRVRKSVEIAKKAGCEKVIFHTNINPFINTVNYKRNWLDRNTEFWSEICDNNPEILILMENMFDDSPDDLLGLSENMSRYKNFGVCFDYAHACVYGQNVGEWASKLSPYIKHVHINDTCGREDLHLPVGKGELDWEMFKKIKKQYFPDADILIETVGYENQKNSLDYMAAHGFFE